MISLFKKFSPVLMGAKTQEQIRTYPTPYPELSPRKRTNNKVRTRNLCLEQQGERAGKYTYTISITWLEGYVHHLHRKAPLIIQICRIHATTFFEA